MMTRPANSCRSLYQLQGRRATGVLLMLLLSVVIVDAASRGVGTRDCGISFYCELSIVGASPRVKIWVGTYRTKALAELACDVALYYTNRPSAAFNLEYSEDAIFRNCKPRSAYDSLKDWEERKRFIKAEANALINSISSQDNAPDFHWEDVAVPPLVPVRQRSGDVASTIVEHFRNEAEQLREFMAWLMGLSNAATQSTHQEHVQTFLQQQGEETVFQSDIVEALLVGGDQFLDATHITLLLDSAEARSGGTLWLTLIASCLPLLFQMFATKNCRAIKDSSINDNEASFTKQERCQSRAELATKRQKVNQPSSSIELVPDSQVQVQAPPAVKRRYRGIRLRLSGKWDEREEKLLEEPVVTVWDDLPADIHEKILHRLDFRGLSRFKGLSKSCKNYVESAAFRQSRTEVSEGLFTAIIYYIKQRAWQCSGYDLHTKSWRALPPLSYLPPPDVELFKEYSVCGHGGLMCAEVSKSPKKGEFVVFNPLTGETKALPPLLFPRNPVLVHIVVNSAQKSYKVIVAGSSTASDEHLSRKMEIFDSSTLEWKSTVDLPGPTFGLNEHQTGVCLNGILFFISYLAGACRRGVVAFDVAKGEWLTNMTCPIPFSSSSNTLQLVESDGKLYLFSEQERGAIVEHCIDEMEFPNPKVGVMSCQWRNVVRVSKSGGRGLLVYPEYTCVGFGKGKLSIFNTLNRDGVVYDTRDGRQCEVLVKPPADQKGDNFFSLNPASFIIQPSFDSHPS